MKTIRSYGGVFISKLAALLVLCAIGLVRAGEGKQTDQRFMGTWSLSTSEFRTTTGTVTYPLGEKAVGLLIYDGRGRMAAQLMRLDRPKFASGDMLKGTPEEIKAAVDGYVAYFGRFAVNSDNRTIVHHVEGSLFPNWLGEDQVRFFEFSSDAQVLTLRTPPFLSGGQEVTGVLIWKRIG